MTFANPASTARNASTTVGSKELSDSLDDDLSRLLVAQGGLVDLLAGEGIVDVGEGDVFRRQVWMSEPLRL